MLRDHILEMERRLFGLTIKDTQRLAFEFAERNGIQHPFNKNTGLAGDDWIHGFFKRNKELALRKPENTSAARASGFNKSAVDKFFSLLTELMDKYHFPPSCIYNTDETGITTVPCKPSKVISMKGKKQVGALATAERGTLVTAEICFSASGNYVPPLLIFPRVRMNPMFEKDLPPESVVVCHHSGWMQQEIFSPIWMNHFITHAKPTPERPVLLLLDGHKTHTMNLDLICRARENNVHIIVLPPHTSHRFQPLDVSFMFPLSCYYEQEVKTFLRNNPGKVVTLYNIGELFGKAYIRAATAANAVSGFKKTGICPCDPHVFPDDVFAPADTTDLPPPGEDETPVPSSTVVTGASNGQMTPMLLDNEDISCVATEPGPSTSIGALSAVGSFVSVASESPRPISLSPSYAGMPKPTSRNSDASPVGVSPADIIPIPHVNPTGGPRANRRRGKTVILTNSPYFNELKQAKAATQNKSTKRKAPKCLFPGNKSSKKKVRKAVIEAETLSDDSDLNLDENLLVSDTSDSPDSENDDQEDSLTEPKDLSPEKVNIDSIVKGDYLLVELGTSGRQQKKRFVCQFLDSGRSSPDSASTSDCTGFGLHVKFMRPYRDSKDTYVWPEIEDWSIVYPNEILGKLKCVNKLRYGKLQFK